MARETNFVVQAFVAEMGRLKAIEPIAAKSASEARERAKCISWRYSGVVAYAHVNGTDAKAGGSRTILAKFGVLPSDVGEWA